MAINSNNIYAVARDAAGFKQVAASMRLGVSVETLCAYENGKRIPAPDVVDRMVTVYHADYLAIQYIREVSQTARRLVPAVEPTGLLPAAVRLYNALREMESKHRLDQLMSIVADGKITAEEQPVMDEIMDSLRELQSSTLEWSVICAGGDQHD